MSRLVGVSRTWSDRKTSSRSYKSSCSAWRISCCWRTSRWQSCRSQSQTKTSVCSAWRKSFTSKESGLKRRLSRSRPSNKCWLRILDSRSKNYRLSLISGTWSLKGIKQGRLIRKRQIFSFKALRRSQIWWSKSWSKSMWSIKKRSKNWRWRTYHCASKMLLSNARTWCPRSSTQISRSRSVTQPKPWRRMVVRSRSSDKSLDWRIKPVKSSNRLSRIWQSRTRRLKSFHWISMTNMRPRSKNKMRRCWSYGSLQMIWSAKWWDWGLSSQAMRNRSWACKGSWSSLVRRVDITRQSSRSSWWWIRNSSRSSKRYGYDSQAFFF